MACYPRETIDNSYEALAYFDWLDQQEEAKRLAAQEAETIQQEAQSHAA
ncbi:hypothetical protein WEU32_06780 [Brevundimonas sp. BH3]